MVKKLSVAILCSLMAAITMTAGPTSAAPGDTIAEATTVEEIVRSSDYSAQAHAPVLRLYQAFFGREPDVNGAKYWLGVSESGWSLDDIAGFFSAGDEFANNYADKNDFQYLEAVYENVLGRDYDQRGFDYWLDLLTEGHLTRGGVVRWISANQEFTRSYPYALRPGQGVTVISARANWSTGYFNAAVTAQLLRELGYNVTDPAQEENPPSWAYRRMAMGELDFWANSWMPLHFDWFDEELPGALTVRDRVIVLGNLLPGAGLEGFVVTKSVAEAHDITSLQQINGDPKLVALFDYDGNGKANVNGCPVDWTCDDIAQAIFDRNGWTNLEQTTASYDGMVAETLARVNDGLPAIQYTWSPSAYLTQLKPGENVLWLSLGGAEFVCDGTDPCQEGWDWADLGPAPLGDTCTEADCYIGWSWADIKITANKNFIAENPAAAQLFRNMVIPVQAAVEASERYNNGENSEDDVKAIAAEWIAANRQLVDYWVQDAARAAGF